MRSLEETISILKELRDNKELIRQIRQSSLSRPYDSERDLFETGFRDALDQAIGLFGLKEAETPGWNVQPKFLNEDAAGPSIAEFDSLIEDFQSKTFNDDGIEDLAQIIPILKSDNLSHLRRFVELERMILNLAEEVDRLTDRQPQSEGRIRLKSFLANPRGQRDGGEG